MKQTTKPAWNGKTFGTGWMHRSLTQMLRVVDPRIFYVFAAVCIAPFCLFLPATRHAYRFLRHTLRQGRIAAAWGTFANVVLFSQVVIDRFAMYAGRRFDIRTSGYEHFRALADADEGFIQLSAHVGNYELAGYSLTSDQKPMNALIFAGEKESVIEARRQMFSQTGIQMIAIREDMSHVFRVNEALADGEIVSMPADRVVGSQKRVEVSLFGQKAQLPAGPFLVAAMRGSSVLAVNVMKSGVRQYAITVTPLHYDTAAPRRLQASQLAQAYADELERVVRAHPCQWYNYFDFFRQ